MKSTSLHIDNLTDVEIGHLPKLKALLCSHVGSDNCITSKTILSQMLLNGVNLGMDSRLRKMISNLRRNGLCDLAANSNGYYIENDLNKLKDYAKSMRARASSMSAVADVIDGHIKKKRAENAGNDQGEMFTKID